MKKGALVITKIRWGMDSRYIGLVLQQIGQPEEDKWLVLWSMKGTYKTQEHLGAGLIDLTHETTTA